MSVLQYLTLPPQKFSEINPNGFEIASADSLTNLNEIHQGSSYENRQLVKK